ncbi:MAG TPA: thymidine phosphorylase, partial [Ignisphaera sp.]|nr:thymidine phosphorylase [Ignisphaera sp.]
IQDVVSGALGEAEIAAFIASEEAIPLSNEELTALIKAIARSGYVIEWNEPAYDEHSIGGVPGNSKVAMLAVPIVASTGVLIPKTSSRAITSPAGTADTMEVLTRVDLSPSEIKEIARKTRGVLVWGGALNIAIADDIFVEIERRIMVDPPSQMVASILAKKVAMGISGLVIDIPVGKGAKVQDHSDAERIAGLFIGQCGRLGIKTKVVLTFGGEPIGKTVGPALEAAEALQTLISGRGSHSLVDKAIAIAGQVLELSGRVEAGKGDYIAREILEHGKAYQKMKEIIEAQGGNPNIKPSDIPIGQYTYTFTSPIEGAVTNIDNIAITLIARAAGAPLDKGAGIRFHVKIGYRVRKGDPLFTIHSSSEARLDEAIKLAELYNPVLVEGMVLKTLP